MDTDMTPTPASTRDDDTGSSPVARSGRRVAMAQRLSSRAVVGGLLVAAAALGVFLAYLDAVRTPTSSYLVALDEIGPGTIVEDLDHATSLFGAVATDLAPAVAGGAVTQADIGDVVGRQVVAPMRAGDLLLRSNAVAGSDQRDAHLLSISLAPEDALSGRLQSGQRVDIVATYTAAGDAVTKIVARDVPVTAVDGDTAQGLGVARLVVTLAVVDDDDVLSIGHAARTASVFLARPVGDPERRGDVEPYRPDLPTPAGDTARGVVPPTVGEGAVDVPATRHPITQRDDAAPAAEDD